MTTATKMTAAILTAALTLALGESAQSGPLAPGTTQYKPGTVPVLGPPNYSTAPPAYFILANQVKQATYAYVQQVGALQGSLTSTIYLDRATGCLSFDYLFTSTGPVDLARATVGGTSWKDITISNAGSDGSGSSQAGWMAPMWTDGDPLYISRYPTVFGAGLSIEWLDDARGTYLFGPNDRSAHIFFETDAKGYGTATFAMIDGGSNSSVLGYVPGDTAPPVPEPAGIILLGGALLGLAALKRRK